MKIILDGIVSVLFYLSDIKGIKFKSLWDIKFLFILYIKMNNRSVALICGLLFVIVCTIVSIQCYAPF